jgi:GNAT superfamily N-acetyltransferase
MNNKKILVKSFTWDDWFAMWKLQAWHLADGEIYIDNATQGPPDFNLPYDETNPKYPEMDMERIDLAYLSGRGNFWMAWIDDQPVGMVGAQDMGEFIELRRMYVRQEYRRRGIGTLLVQALIDHCKQKGVKSIKLWTEDEGPGRYLYSPLGFRQVEPQGEERIYFRFLQGEIRMLKELT